MYGKINRMEQSPGVCEVLQPSAPKERMTALENKCAIKMENITKRFGKVVANNAINMELREGEILSLLGENGSGKTTLMNMLSGIYFPDEGQIYIHDKPVTIASPKDAFALGIGMIHQHFKLVDLFTATENIILGLEGKLDLANARKKVQDICDKYGFDIDPDMKIYDMSVSQKQTVEIVKVLYRGADILILDEPTAVLTPQETDKLFAVMRNMKADGKSLIIITHKLHEVLDVSDRVAVLRKGEYIGDVLTKDADQQSLTDMMVGRSVSLNINRPEPKNVTTRLKLEGLTVFDELGVKRLDNVSFDIKAGEVLGVAGVAGCVGLIFLLPHAMARVKVWLDPFSDFRGDGWQGAQSLMAIGSGGFWGLGLGQGRQKHLFLPEPANDFIFSVVCEELGMVGAVLIMIVFAALIVRGFQIALRAPDRFGTLLVAGITTQIAVQTIFNMGVVTGLLPVTGISLPFFSYGGTALMIQLAEMGIVLSVSRQIPAPKAG